MLRFIKFEVQSLIKVSIGPGQDIALKKCPKTKEARGKKSMPNCYSKAYFKWNKENFKNYS